jgi:hypothetical protein
VAFDFVEIVRGNQPHAGSFHDFLAAPTADESFVWLKVFVSNLYERFSVPEERRRRIVKIACLTWPLLLMVTDNTA